MGKDPKKSKKRELSTEKKGGLRFELEPNAQELFLNHLRDVKPSKELAEEPRKAEVSRSVGDELTQLDLHGMTVPEAEFYLRGYLDRLRQIPGLHRVKIITGKGRNSLKGQGVLAQRIHQFVVEIYGPWLDSIESSPHATQIGGMPLRGHFHMVIRGRN